MRNISELIEKFISRVRVRYPNIHVEYSYDEELNEYDIWHNDQELEFNNKEFAKYVGEQADELLFANNIYNFSFSYNYLKAKELECKNKSYNMVILQDVEYKFVQMVAGYKHLNYKENLNRGEDCHLNIEFEKNDTSSHSDKEAEYKISPTNYMGTTFYGMNLMGVA